MDARQILEQQHEEILSLFKKLTATGDGLTGELQERDALLARLTARLQLHSRLEETYLYPALKRLDTPRSEGMVLESYEEHAIVDSLLAQLPGDEEQNERFLARVRVLQFLVEAHIEEEESVIFKLAEKLGDARLLALGERMLQHIEEVESLERIVERAADAARQTERWAARWFERGMEMPRRAIGRLAPTRLFRLEERSQWIGALAARTPTWLVEGAVSAIEVLDTMVRRPQNGGGPHNRTGTREHTSRAA